MERKHTISTHCGKLIELYAESVSTAGTHRALSQSCHYGTKINLSQPSSYVVRILIFQQTTIT